MSTEGVMVMKAAEMKLKKLRTFDGSVETKCRKVPYEAMMIGGSGGSAGCEVLSIVVKTEGW
jgi:hypothetical protein